MAYNSKEVADVLNNFLSGKGDEWDWDDFISVPIEDPELNAIRVICASLPQRFPPKVKGNYCSKEGFALLENLLNNLREH